MEEKYLLSSAYFPPIHYVSLISRANKVFIEQEENYLKQTYRNRCLVLTANGQSALTVPVLSGSSKKTCIKDIRIDYSKRWQQVHLRALQSAYKSSAFFEYFFDDIEKVIAVKTEYLLELNMNSLGTILKIIGIKTPVEFTDTFEPAEERDYDFRYIISPKKGKPGNYSQKEYYQVFSNKFRFTGGLSILDLVFNAGPDSVNYL